MSYEKSVVRSTLVTIKGFLDGKVENKTTLTEYSNGSVTFSDESGSIFKRFRNVAAARRWLDKG